MKMRLNEGLPFVDGVEVGSICVKEMRIQVGAMDYGFEIDGIIGVDLLMKAKIVIDTGRLEVYV